MSMLSSAGSDAWPDASDGTWINTVAYTLQRDCNYWLGKHSCKISILGQYTKCLYFDPCYVSSNEEIYFKVLQTSY